MKHEPSDSTLTKIDAYILRSLELETDLKHSELEKRIKARYGFDIDVKERLKEYTPRNDDNNFIFWN